MAKNEGEKKVQAGKGTGTDDGSRDARAGAAADLASPKRGYAPARRSRSGGAGAKASFDAAYAHAVAGRTAEAEALCHKILAGDPRSAEALYLLGGIAAQGGNAPSAIELFKQALKAKPGFAEAHANLGTLLLDRGEAEEAINHFEKAIESEPHFALAYNNLGIALQNQGKLEEAIASFQKAVALEPNYAEALSNLANVLQELGDVDEAVASYRKALLIKPDFAMALANLGSALYKQGELDAAVASFRKAVALEPEYAEAHNSLGKVLTMQGKVNEAVGYFRTAERLGPGDGKNVAAFRVSLLDEDKARKGEPYVKQLKDVLVDTAHWSILDGDKVYSHETHGRNLANNPFIMGRVNPEKTRVIAVYPDPEIVVKERCILVGGGVTYSHWILGNLMKLSIIENNKDLQSLPLLLNAELAPHESEALELLGISRDRQILVNRNSIIKCNNIYVPTLLRDHPKMKMGLDWLRRRFLTEQEITAPKNGDRIFVSRRDANRRHIVNEEALLERLTKFGFSVVVPGRMSFSEQVKTFANAGIVIGAHGAGLANIVFAPLDCQIIEITSTPAEYMDVFRRISTELGQKVVSIVSDSIVPPSGKTDTLALHYDFLVDVEKVVSVVIGMIADSSA